MRRLALTFALLFAGLAAGPGRGHAQDASAADAGLEADAGAEAAAPATPGAASGSLAQLRSGAAVPFWQRLVSVLGLAVMVALAWLMSARRDLFPWRIVLFGVGLQMVFGIFILKTPVGLALFSVLNDVFARVLQFTEDGSRFLFGAYLDQQFTVALNVLPTIIFFSALMSVLYHVGVMQRLVQGVAWVMQRTLRTSGAETLSAAANIFVGQTEAPLVVKPFVAKMTLSELMAVMVGGFATVAGGVLAAYVGMLQVHFPDIAGHLIAASVMSAPASLLIAKVLQPETEFPVTATSLEQSKERPHANIIDAAAGGATDGLQLAFNVGAMLLAFLALVAMVNYVFALPALWHNQVVWAELLEILRAAGDAVPEGCATPEGADGYATCIGQLTPEQRGDLSAWTPLSLERILSWLFWPIALAMGVPPEDCTIVASLLGEKIVLNEFVSYLHLVDHVREGALSHRAVVITSYALCGFANIGSIGIQLGGIGALAPERRGDLARIGVRAMLGGTLAAFMTACVAGIFV